MSIRLVTLNGTVRCNGPYILRCRRKTIIRPTLGSKTTFDIL